MNQTSTPPAPVGVTGHGDEKFSCTEVHRHEPAGWVTIRVVAPGAPVPETLGGERMRKRRMWCTGVAVAAATVMAASSVAAAAEPLGPFTEAEVDDHWVVDRSEPSGGWGSVSFADRDDVLRLGIDSSAPSAAPDASTFHRTEGLQKDADFGTDVEVDLYLDPGWHNRAVRAGAWVVGWDHDVDPPVRTDEFAIVEFTTAGGDLGAGDPVVRDERWRVWHSSVGWVDLPDVPFTYGEWVTVGIAYDLDAGHVEYSIDRNLVHTQPSGTNDGEPWGTDTLGEAFLNSYNYAYEDIAPGFSAASYDVHWAQAQAPPPPSPPGGKRCPILRLNLRLLRTIPLNLCL